MSRTILYQGLLRSPASWARVGRGYVGALLRAGVQVPVVAPRGFGYDAAFPLPEALAPGALEEWTAAQARGRSVPYGLGFLHPPQLDRLLGDFRANLFVWEADRVPASWVERLRGVDRVFVPSLFTRDALVRSGLEERRIRVVPYGHDGVHFAVSRRDGPFRVVAVLSPHRRKGVMQLLRAYRAAFSSADEVLLEIKTTYDPGSAERGRRFPFEIESWGAALGAARLHEPAAPPVRVEVATLSDAETRRLYERADLCVQPSWGEAFGLAVLEAAASGRPVVTTGWSGPLEFLPGSADLLPYRLEEAGDALYEPVPGARVAIPSVDALVARLRWHYDHRAASRELGERAQRAVAELTWDAAARKLLAELG